MIEPSVVLTVEAAISKADGRRLRSSSPCLRPSAEHGCGRAEMSHGLTSAPCSSLTALVLLRDSWPGFVPYQGGGSPHGERRTSAVSNPCRRRDLHLGDRLGCHGRQARAPLLRRRR